MGNPHDPHATLASLKRTGALITACAFVLSGACGFSSSSDSSTATTEPGEIGAGLNAPTTGAPVTQAPATTAAQAPAAADPCKTRPTSSTVTRDDRIKLTLSVSRVCASKGDDIGLSLVVTNTSSSVIHYDPNQLTVFVIRAPQGEQRRRWEDDDCATRTSEIKRAQDIAPGASITLNNTYPAPASVGSRESCRRLEGGDYEVHATILVCDESYQDGYCDTAKDTQYTATPVRITVSG